jgi:hypothetical protein
VKLGRAEAVTYGLVATELVEHRGDDGFAPHLINRFGLANLRDAAEAVSDLPEDLPRAPDSVLARRLSEFVANNLARVVAPILTAADTSESLDHEVSDPVRRLIDSCELELHPIRLRRAGRTLWGHRCDNLIQRAAVEAFELHATGARLRRCIYCKSVFVPRRDERHCQWNIWPAWRREGDPPLRLCSSARHAAVRRASDTDITPLVAHTRERKRLYAKEARARKAALARGEDPETSLLVTRLRDARLRYMEDSSFKRGRKADDVDPPDLTTAE